MLRFIVILCCPKLEMFVLQTTTDYRRWRTQGKWGKGAWCLVQKRPSLAINPIDEGNLIVAFGFLFPEAISEIGTILKAKIKTKYISKRF